MSDAQLGILITALTGMVSLVVGVIRWSVGRITKAIDDNTESHRETAKAQVTLASEMATLSTKIDSVADWVQEHTPVEVPIPKRPTTQTTYLELRKTPAK